MKLMFVGATRTVTGSCYLLDVDGYKCLIDCGLYQGGRAIELRNREGFPFNPREIQDVLLTHAHIDHAGLLPKLVRDGFAGKIRCHKATADLASVMLRDSAHIQESQATLESKKRARRGLPAVEPLYEMMHAEAAARLFAPVEYGGVLDLAGGKLRVEFLDAGHILGSSILRLSVREADGTLTVLFSGDLGNSPAPILNDPAQFESADVVLMESTYGDRLHENREEREDRLAGIVRDAAMAGGTVLIPAFAVGRTQELLYALNHLRTKNAIPKIPVYIDSPLAGEATAVFRRHPECYDAEMRALIAQGDDPLGFEGLKVIGSAEESMALNHVKGPKVIISASGMATSGRILHHLKHNLWQRNTTVLFVGYQGQGTLGRALLGGAKTVQIHGESVRVAAHIDQIGGFSAHADQKGLLDWLGRLSRPPRRVFLIHGEEDASQALASKINERYGAPLAVVPIPHQTVTLTAKTEDIGPVPQVPEDAPPLEAVDLPRELAIFVDEVVSKAKTLARDAKQIRARLKPDKRASREFDDSLRSPLDSLRSRLDRVLSDLAGK